MVMILLKMINQIQMLKITIKLNIEEISSTNLFPLKEKTLFFTNLEQINEFERLHDKFTRVLSMHTNLQSFYTLQYMKRQPVS